MKKNLLLFASIILFAAQTKAQTSMYYPFPDSSAMWNETVTWYNGQCDGNEFYGLFINGDTIIGSNVYHKLLETGYSYSSICDTSAYFTNEYVAAFRENTSLKKVYIVPKADTIEMLLYDFNLSLGDTLPATYEGAADYNYVISVDSVLIGSKYRKSLGISVLDSAFDYTTLIEGVGSSFGFIAPIAPHGEYWYLLNCFSQNGQSLYPDTLASCIIPTGIKQLPSENIVSLYPNPANNQIAIRTSLRLHEKNLTVSIMNVLGQEVDPLFSPIQRKGEDDLIDISKLSAGIYFLQMKWVNGVTVQKFIKE